MWFAYCNTCTLTFSSLKLENRPKVNWGLQIHNLVMRFGKFELSSCTDSDEDYFTYPVLKLSQRHETKCL